MSNNRATGVNRCRTSCWNEILGIIFLLLEGLGEGSNAGNDTGNHEQERDDGPQDAPALRRPAISPGEDAGVGTVYLSEDEVITLHRGDQPMSGISQKQGLGLRRLTMSHTL